MAEFNYRQEFPLIINFYYKGEDGKLQAFGFPAFSFKIFFWTTSRADNYVASCHYEDGVPKFTNCKRIGDSLVVIFDNHRLNPGKLHSEMIMDVPSDLYPDGFRRDIIAMHTDVLLIHGPTPPPSRAEITAILPYIVGKDGKDGKDFTYEDLTEEQKEEFAKKVAENIETELPDIELEDIPDTFFSDIFDD